MIYGSALLKARVDATYLVSQGKQEKIHKKGMMREGRGG
jgi:hypothetical protein